MKRPAATHTVATRRLRTDRMLLRVAEPRAAELLRRDLGALREKLANGDLSINGARAAMGLKPFVAASSMDPETAAQWQAEWDATVGNDIHRPLLLLPGKAEVHQRDPKTNPRRRARGPQRMREHTYTLLLNALRSDGTLDSTIQVQTCKAYRVLPWDIGLRAQSSDVEVPKRVTQADLADAYRDYVIEPIESYISKGLASPAQMRVMYGTDLPETDAERESRLRVTTRAFESGLSPAARIWLGLDEPERPSFVDLFHNPDLLGTTSEPQPPRGWFGRLFRRITRRNGDPA